LDVFPYRHKEKSSMGYEDFVSSKRRNRIIGSTVTIVILCAVAFFIFGYLLRTEDPRRQKGAIGEILELAGGIQLVRNFDDIPNAPGMIVMSGDFFRTKDDGHVKVKYLDDGTQVTIGNNSNLIFNAIENGKRMNLGKGTMTVTTPEQMADKSLAIVTHSAEVIVLEEGTFTFKFIGLDAILSVQSGKMRFRRFTDGEVVELSTGQSHTFEPAGPKKIEFEM
jgi:ferric-dicitrate binding protein FerR (iron transport regulator)